MIIKHLLVAGCLCLFITFHNHAQTTYETDFQVWNDTQVIFPLTRDKSLNAVVWTFGRVGDDVQTVTDARAGMLLTKRLNKNVTVGGGYLYRYSNPTFRQRRYESRYLGIATFTVPFHKKWAIVNRNMYQYENRYSRPNSTVIRNRAWLKREIKVRNKKIEPFISFETFYDFRLKDFARFRSQGGFSRILNDRFAADFFYVRQDETSRSRPGTLNGIGTSFRITAR